MCNKCYQLAYLALLYSESDAFYYLEMTWKTHINHIVAIMCLLSSRFFVFSLATVEIALATAIAEFLQV